MGKTGISRATAQGKDGVLRFAMPSDRIMEQDALHFMEDCGLRVVRPSVRQYQGEIAGVKGVSVLFQRSADIPAKIDEGSVDIGIVGLDRYHESRNEKGDTSVIIEDLGFSKCELVLAVPNSWTHVCTTKDLGEVAREFKAQGNALRIATKYNRLSGKFLESKGLKEYKLIQSSGAMEAAPSMGYADMIADISSSGATLRENNLKTLDDGTVLKSQACLIGNKRLITNDPAKLQTTKRLLELVEARLRAGIFYHIIGNIQGESPEVVAKRVMSSSDVSGMQGPTISRVYSKTGERDWFSVSVVVPMQRLTDGVEHLRKIGASGVVVFPAHYVFENQCRAFQTLVAKAPAARGK